MRRQNWTYVIVFSHCPHNSKTGHFTSRKEQEGLWSYCFSSSNMQTLLAENLKVKVTPLACLNSTFVSVLLSMTKNHHLGNLSVIVKRGFTPVTCTGSYSVSTKREFYSRRIVANITWKCPSVLRKQRSVCIIWRSDPYRNLTADCMHLLCTRRQGHLSSEPTCLFLASANNSTTNKRKQRSTKIPPWAHMQLVHDHCHCLIPVHLLLGMNCHLPASWNKR